MIVREPGSNFEHILQESTNKEIINGSSVSLLILRKYLICEHGILIYNSCKFVRKVLRACIRMNVCIDVQKLSSKIWHVMMRRSVYPLPGPLITFVLTDVGLNLIRRNQTRHTYTLLILPSNCYYNSRTVR
jgi:hypothetical protein